MGYTIPTSESKTSGVAVKQEVVRRNLVEREMSSPDMVEQNAGHVALPDIPCIAAEIECGNIKVRLFNGADTAVIKNTLQCIGGLSIITVTGTVVNIALNYWLIPICGMFGAALATVSVQVLIFIAHDVLARFYIGGYHYCWKFYFKGIVPVLLMMVAAYGFMDLFIVRWVLALIIAIIALREMIKNRGFF